jgi:hypothetical protein
MHSQQVGTHEESVGLRKYIQTQWATAKAVPMLHGARPDNRSERFYTAIGAEPNPAPMRRGTRLRPRRAPQADRARLVQRRLVQRRLVLAHAVNRAAFAQDIATIKAENRSLRETAANDFNRLRIARGLVVGRHQHRSI